MKHSKDYTIQALAICLLLVVLMTFASCASSKYGYRDNYQYKHCTQSGRVNHRAAY